MSAYLFSVARSDNMEQIFPLHMIGGSRKVNEKKYMGRKELRGETNFYEKLWTFSTSGLYKRVSDSGTLYLAWAGLHVELTEQLFKKYYDIVVLGELSRKFAKQAFQKD